MKFFSSERGIALITTLLLNLVCLLLVAGVTQIVVTGTKMSGTVKRYTSALEAAKGGIEDFVSSLLDTDFNVAPSDSRWVSGHNCKVNRDTDNWLVVCGEDICGSDNSKCTSHAQPEDIIDYTDWVGTYGQYTVYVKIVDVKGTIDGYYLYTIETVAKKNANFEKAWVTVFYRRE